jgi:alpha-L-rhamnosidase
MERLAKLVGCEDDMAVYREAEEKMYAAFQEKFYRPEEHLYDTGFWREYDGVHREKYRQTSNLLPLEADMVPAQYREEVLERLVQDIHEKGDHLDTGCVGTRIILPVLADNGYADLAWKVLKQDTYPGWGYLLAQGSDTMWENWESATRSYDHYFFGTCDEFFYSHLSGIRSVQDGCKRVTIKPLFCKELAYAGASIQTVRGELACEWKWENGCAVDATEGEQCTEKKGRVILEIKVPYGAEAKIILPAGKIEILKGREGIIEHCGESELIAVSGEYVIGLECV